MVSDRSSQPSASQRENTMSLSTRCASSGAILLRGVWAARAAAAAAVCGPHGAIHAVGGQLVRRAERRQRRQRAILCGQRAQRANAGRDPLAAGSAQRAHLRSPACSSRSWSSVYPRLDSSTMMALQGTAHAQRERQRQQRRRRRGGCPHAGSRSGCLHASSSRSGCPLHASARGRSSGRPALVQRDVGHRCVLQQLAEEAAHGAVQLVILLHHQHCGQRQRGRRWSMHAHARYRHAVHACHFLQPLAARWGLLVQPSLQPKTKGSSTAAHATRARAAHGPAAPPAAPRAAPPAPPLYSPFRTAPAFLCSFNSNLGSGSGWGSRRLVRRRRPMPHACGGRARCIPAPWRRARALHTQHPPCTRRSPAPGSAGRVAPAAGCTAHGLQADGTLIFPRRAGRAG